MLKHSGQLLVIGGVARNVMLTKHEEIIILNVVKSGVGKESVLASKVHCEGLFPQLK
jgi:hypothetical protein